MKLLFLGTGTSVGVPQIGCDCPVCTSTDPHDKRRRCGVYVQTGSANFLIDTPPEMREAALCYGVKKVDAICLTHAHMDHVAGFDDVRRFNTINGGAPMRCYALPETIEQMHRIFPYITDKANTQGLFRPMINFVDNSSEFRIGNLSIEALKVEHGFPCCGYLMSHVEVERGRIAYISDCHELPPGTIEKLQGVRVLILNCLRERFHPTHLNFEAAKKYFELINPEQGYIIHMCHDISHEEWTKKWASTGLNVRPAYDGMEIEI